MRDDPRTNRAPRRPPLTHRVVAPAIALVGVLVICVAFAALTGCIEGRAPDQDFRNFKKAVGQSKSEAWTPYWLGRRFQAGGLTFIGPAVGDDQEELTGGGLSYTYNALNSGPGLEVRLYSRGAWQQAQHLYAVKPVGNVPRDVTIAGHPGVIEASPAGTRPVNAVVAYVQLGDTMVVVVANSGGSPTPGAPDINPLIDEPTLLSVLTHLRPYPQ